MPGETPSPPPPPPASSELGAEDDMGMLHAYRPPDGSAEARLDPLPAVSGLWQASGADVEGAGFLELPHSTAVLNASSSPLPLSAELPAPVQMHHGFDIGQRLDDSPHLPTGLGGNPWSPSSGWLETILNTTHHGSSIDL
ncbi:uncharacterized protein BDZ99DRAFT_470862 [Mytilinidion resinicola]|uniref:Uncharacterized protein n=1 Tax=Mytilinidion resinicola TaxID=574789 RepID=A0A6A6ZA72_9PEZI|nr:uncharacterized protein BDZ99DRAFT_470862 [Mytilinidion resinicola]KAF2817916.1 hypothetical protein BDZ99DRAFT_470862 [Mytilinidion resinicola]